MLILSSFFKLSADGLLPTEVSQPTVVIQLTNDVVQPTVVTQSTNEAMQPTVIIQPTSEAVQPTVVMQSTVETQPDSVTNQPTSVVIQQTIVVQPTVVVQSTPVTLEEFNNPVQSRREPVEHDGNTSLLHNDIKELQLYQNILGVFVCKENSVNLLYCPSKEYNQYIRKGFW